MGGTIQSKEMLGKRSYLAGIDISEKAICASKDGEMELRLHIGKMKERQFLLGSRFRRHDLTEGKVFGNIIVECIGELVDWLK